MCISIENNNIITRSHMRCKEYGINKSKIFPDKILRGIEFKELYKRKLELIKIAKPFMKILYDFLKGSGFFLDLTDENGIILIVIGDEDVIEKARSMGMIEGADMSEKSTGTNAIGTSIYENNPIQMAGKQHYLNVYHIWTCSADTIHDVNGNIIGCLNLTGRHQLVHPHTLGLVVAAVKSIENHMEMNKSQNELFQAYQYLHTIINSIDVGILTIDSSGIVRSINNIACMMLKVRQYEVIDKNIKNLIFNWRNIYDEISNGNRYENNNCTVNGKSKRFNLNAYPIRNKKNCITGAALVLRDIQKVYNMVNRYIGMKARYNFSDIIGKSKIMMDLKKKTKCIADSPSTVLIQGESGTGKELIAQAIHNSSNRRNFGFIAINCGAIPKNLIESELFGYEDGTFTGAKKGGQLGKFELADNGTIFLDEISEMPIDMQVNLLRVLQEGCIMKIGGKRYIKINVRIIAATNKDLKEQVKKGNFREDLYYRLSVIPIYVPPLRDRIGDIPILIDHFLKTKSSKLNKSMVKIETSLYNKLLNYKWPGNIRELENCIENIVNMDGNISFDFVKYSDGIYRDFSDNCEYNMCSLDQWQKIAIEKCIRMCNGNISKASKILKINRTTLYNKINRYGLKDKLQ